MVTEPLSAKAAQLQKRRKTAKASQIVCFRQNAFILAKAPENFGYGENSLI